MKINKADAKYKHLGELMKNLEYSLFIYLWSVITMMKAHIFCDSKIAGLSLISNLNYYIKHILHDNVV